MEDTFERQAAVQEVEKVIHTQSNLEADLKFSPEYINDAYTDQSAKYAYWSVMSVQAKAAMDKKKWEVERQEEYLRKALMGKLDLEVRHNLADMGERVTEAKVTNNIYAHPLYLEAQAKLYSLQDELAELQRQYGLLYAAKDAMNHRKDMLVSLGAQLRQDSENEPMAVRGN